jgi:hypothetical protein
MPFGAVRSRRWLIRAGMSGCGGFRVGIGAPAPRSCTLTSWKVGASIRRRVGLRRMRWGNRGRILGRLIRSDRQPIIAGERTREAQGRQPATWPTATAGWSFGDASLRQPLLPRIPPTPRRHLTRALWLVLILGGTSPARMSVAKGMYHATVHAVGGGCAGLRFGRVW